MRTATVKIHRYSQDENQTLGSCIVLDEKNQPLFASVSLERGWRNNERGVSCIPQGFYDLVYEWSARFTKSLWEIKNVPNRSECKLHSANYWDDLEGCIALGATPKDINSDGYIDIVKSTRTMSEFHSVLKDFDKVILEIDGNVNIC